jgi:hypothetical protein
MLALLQISSHQTWDTTSVWNKRITIRTTLQPGILRRVKMSPGRVRAACDAGMQARLQSQCPSSSTWRNKDRHPQLRWSLSLVVACCVLGDVSDVSDVCDDAKDKMLSSSQDKGTPPLPMPYPQFVHQGVRISIWLRIQVSGVIAIVVIY